MQTSIGSATQELLPSADPEHRKQKLSSIFDLACVLFGASKKLCYPIQTAGTALQILHRFVAEIGEEKALQSNKAVLMVTILFLSGKLTEQFRRNREILAVVLRLCGYPHELNDEKRLALTVEKIIEKEQVILRLLGFNLEFQLPYIFVFNIARTLRLTTLRVKLAISLVNEMLLHASLASQSPCLLAVAALQVSSKYVSPIDITVKKLSFYYEVKLIKISCITLTI